jgi:WD40 repeat protein
MNLCFNTEGSLVYPAACLGIVYDFKNQQQKYFGGGRTEMGGRKQTDNTITGHTDDVTALAISKDRKLVATGQNGVKPTVWIWDSVTCEPLPKGKK